MERRHQDRWDQAQLGRVLFQSERCQPLGNAAHDKLNGRLRESYGEQKQLG